jgi:MFS family permease
VPPPERAINFVLFASAQGISSVGTWMHKAAVGWIAWDMTHSPAWIGAMAMTDLVAALWVAPLAGAVADRQNGFRLLLLTQGLLLVLALVLFGVFEAGQMTIVLLWLLCVVEATLQGFNQPVRMSTIGLLAGKERLSQAIASNSIAANSARSVGPALAGIIMVQGSPGFVFLANSVSYLAMIGVVFYLRRWLDRPPGPPLRSLRGDIGAGFSYVVTTPKIATLFMLTLVFALFARSFTDLFPAIAGSIFNGGPGTLAALMSAQGVGALFGAGWMLKRRPAEALVGITFAAGVGLSVALVLFSSTAIITVAVPVMVLAGLFHVVCNIGMQVMAQTHSDAAFRGRVLSLYGLLFRSAPALGALAIGAAAAFFDMRLLLCASGVIGAVAILVIFRHARGVYGRVPPAAGP